MKNRFCLLFLIVFSLCILIFSEVEKASAQSSTTTLKIPDVVARVNGVDIQSKFIEFRLSKILKKVRRPLTMREKTSIVKDLIDKEVVRELVHQQGEKKNLKVDPDLIENEFERSIWSGKYKGGINFGCWHRRKMIGRGRKREPARSK